MIQPYIDAARTLREGGLNSAAVTSIECIMAPWAMPIVGEPRPIKIAPRNDLEAIASRPFMVAAALIDGRVDLATLRPETINRHDIRVLASRIDCKADASLGAGFDGRMNVVCSDGRSLSHAIGLVPATEQRVIAKFHANTASQPHVARDTLLRALLDEAPQSRELMRLATAALSVNPA